MLKQSLAFILFFVSASAYGMVGEIALKGKIKSFDEKNINVVSNGVTYIVPRSYTALPNLKENQEVEFKLKPEEFSSLKRETAQKK